MSFMFFLPVILLIGVLTSLTDLINKKIYNQHLIIGAILSIIVVAYTTVFRQEDIYFHIVNCGVAFLIGFLLFRSALWRGGDAKLFILYAFIMPNPYYNQVPFSSTINLFACSFIIGMVILLPVFIKDIIINYRSIIIDFFSIERRRAIFHATIHMFIYSWLMYPLCKLANMNNFIILIISYLIFHKNFYVKKKIVKHYIIKFFKKTYLRLLAGILMGILLRLWLSPSSLSYSSLKSFFIMVGLSSILSACLKTVIDYFREHPQRIAFAPMLFMGCVLSYTFFLTEVMQVAARWKRVY